MTTKPIADGGWIFERNLGVGGFGIVQLWIHKQSQKKLAIKKCRWDKSQMKETQLQRWVNEVNIMKNFQHPNIVKAIDMPFTISNEDVDIPILCMEYCREGDLRTILNRPENCCGLKETEALNAMEDICSAVEYLHCFNITHRDLKPENIVLQNVSNKIVYKLIDLGYAKDLAEASTSASLVGTMNYVAPELLLCGRYSCSVDYWSLGILFYELVTGIRPFLPKMPHNITWMTHIKNKAYEDICAYESDGKIIFGRDIQDPTQISRCIRPKLVDWFRVALQWDSRERGKIHDKDGKLKPVIFKLLHSIVSKKIVYVFAIALYNIYAYEIDETTTVIDLQKWLHTDTNIIISQQVLTDYLGKPLILNEKPLLLQTNDSVLFVFETERSLTQPSLNVPSLVQKMIEQAKNEFPHDTLQNFYRTTIFFIKDEINSFQLYIFAISIKVDLIMTRYNTFNSNIAQAIGDISTLLHDLDEGRSKYAALNNTNAEGMFENIYLKILKLHNAADQIKLKFEPLLKESETLREAASEIHSMSELTEIYHNATVIYEVFKRETNHKLSKPSEMVKVVFDFLRVREVQMHSEWINLVLKKTHHLESQLLKLEKIFDSVLAVITVYRGELQTIISPKVQGQKKDMPSTSNSDTADILNQPDNDKLINVIDPVPHSNEPTEEGDIIYDNLVIRYTMENLLLEMKKRYFEINNFN